MRGRTTIEDLASLNPEIDATCRHNNAARKRREQEIQGSSQHSPPPSLQSYYQMEE